MFLPPRSCFYGEILKIFQCFNITFYHFNTKPRFLSVLDNVQSGVTYERRCFLNVTDLSSAESDLLPGVLDTYSVSMTLTCSVSPRIMLYVVFLYVG